MKLTQEQEMAGYIPGIPDYTQENGPSLLNLQPNRTTKNSVANYENLYTQMKTCVHILIGKFFPVLKRVTSWYYGPPMIQY